MQYVPTGDFAPESVARLENIKRDASDPMERGVTDLILLSQYAAPGSPIKIEDLRGRLKDLAKAHKDTWIAVQAKIGLVETYATHENAKERIEVLESLLTDGGLAQLSNPNDPYLAEFMKSGEGVEIANSPREFVLSRLLYDYKSGYDLVNAERVAAEIKQPYWRAFADTHLNELRKVPPEVLAERRKAFLKGQKS